MNAKVLENQLERLHVRTGAIYGCSVLLERLQDTASDDTIRGISEFHTGALTQAIGALASDASREIEAIKNTL